MRHHGCRLKELETIVKAEEQALEAEPDHQAALSIFFFLSPKITSANVIATLLNAKR